MVKKEILLREYERTRNHVYKHPERVSAVLASIAATLAELGLLTQGSLGYFMELTAPKLFAIMEKEGYIKKGMDAKELIKKCMEFFGFSEDSYELGISDKDIKVGVIAEECPLDPMSVGGMELKSTLCPLPFMLASFLTINDEREWQVITTRKGARVHVVEKKDGKCLMTLKVNPNNLPINSSPNTS